MKEKLLSTEKALHSEEQNHSTTKLQAQERENQLEASITELTKAVATAQRNLEEKSNEIARVSSQTKDLQDSNKQLKQELADYKVRATKVLQEKEKSIKELSVQLQSNSETHPEINISDYIQVQQERDSLKQELQQAQDTIQQLKNNMMEIQTQVEADTESLQAQIKDLEDSLEREKKRVQSMQMQSLIQTQEITTLREEMEKQNSNLNSTIKGKEEEIQKLKKQVAAKSTSSSSQEELENRLQTITDHLIQKQNQLETALSEKAYLQLQLENYLQNQNDKKLSERDDKHHTTIVVDDLSNKKRNHSTRNDDGPRLRSIASLVESTTSYNEQSAIGRRVIGAAQLIDSISNITGSYLRHYPLARLGVIFYMLLLHLWVFYVFITWNPEMHPGDKSPIG